MTEKSSGIENIAGRLERAIANAVAETIQHGGSQKDVSHIIGEFKKLTEEETHDAVGKIPD